MIGFEITIDGERICTAGVGDLGVLSAIATWVRRTARDPDSGEALAETFEEELTLDVGGLAHEDDGTKVHAKWFEAPLHVGQEILIRVVDVPTADSPTTEQREDPKFVERAKRDYYESLRREYGDA